MPTLNGYACDDLDARRQQCLATGRLNGVDDVEIDLGAHGGPRDCTLLVRCLLDVPAGLRSHAVAVRPHGTPHGRAVDVVWAAPAVELAAMAAEGVTTAADVDRFAADEAASRLLVVRVAAPGDRSAYRFVVRDPEREGFDPLLSEATFSFGVGCDDDVDCPAQSDCPPVQAAEPVIDYLSRDYAGLRQLLLDRLSLVAGTWKDRNVADTGVTIVEIFAYLGDVLAAAQDAVAAEAYLGTARRRVSVARHARLLDYPMHHGAASRVWLALEVDDAVSAGFARLAACLPGEERLEMIPAGHEIYCKDGTTPFHTLHPTTPLAARNRIELHTWGLRECCLPVGATSATLVGTRSELGLTAGDVLIFEEVRGVAPGVRADETHRWPVRLALDPEDDYDPATDTDVVHVSWYDEDRLPFPLCARRFSGGRCEDDHCVAVVLGNVVLAGHGRLVGPEPVTPASVPLLGPYAPIIDRPGMAFAVPYVDKTARSSPAAHALSVDPREALAELVRLTDGRNDWTLQRDLLRSDRFALEVVAEPDDDGTVHLRFGNDTSGRRPSAGQTFEAQYRIGGGIAGNVGRDVLTALIPDVPGVRVRNPMPATGGADPEPMEQVRQSAPQVFRGQQRAVTDDDYAAIARRDPHVQRAVGTRRWTGSWYTEFVTVDQLGGNGLDPALAANLTSSLERYRMAGSDVVVQPPVYVPLSIELAVRVKSDSFRGTVKRALQQAFSTRDLPGGGGGFFHPDRFTFGTPLYVSAVIAAAMAVPGIDWVDVKVFQRLGTSSTDELADGVIRLDRLEVLRCDSDPGDATSGQIRFSMSGGL